MTTTTLTETIDGKHRHITRVYAYGSGDPELMGGKTLRACRSLNDSSRFILVVGGGFGDSDIIEHPATIEELRERWAVYHNSLIADGFTVHSTEGIEPGA